MSMLICIGLGYCARHVVAEFRSRFTRVVGTSRAPDQAIAAPVEMLAFDGTHASPELRAAIADASHLLISAAPGETGDPVLAALADDIEAASRLASIVYLSSLGVYGDHGGAWIDETAPTIPAHTRGAARVDAELAWQAIGRKRGVPVAILRLAGIYGPGQNAFIRLRAGRAHRIAKPGHVFNRIHAVDIAQAIDAAFARNFDGVINVCDDLPAPPGDQIEFAAALLGVEPPPELSLDEARRTLSPFILSFYEGCARVRNDKLKRELGVALRYPTYREGLQALHDGGYEARDPLAQVVLN
jgi:nucleoside-diphosphate-sugar epimerase